MRIVIPVSVGELIDKITILELKSMFSDSEYIHKELELLHSIADDYKLFYNQWVEELYEVNQKLWNIEDRLREKEKLQEFDNEFIELARSVYITNDKRAEIKKKINELNKSEFQEIKLYQ